MGLAINKIISIKLIFLLIFMSLFFDIHKKNVQAASCDIVNSDTLTSGLISYWEFEETSGTRYDSVGSVDFTPYNTPSYGTGIQGNAVDIEDDSSQYLKYLGESGLAPNDSYSVAFWIKIESLPDGGSSDESYGIFSSWSNDGSHYMYRQMDLAGKSSPAQQLIRAYHAGSAESYNPYNWTALVAVDTWYFVVNTVDYNATNGNKLYILQLSSSVLATVNAKPQSNSGAGTDFVIIGELASSAATGYSRFFDGLIDEFGLWNRVLTTDEISELFNAGSGIPLEDEACAGGGGTVYIDPPKLIWW